MEPYNEPHRNRKSIGDYIDFKDIVLHPSSYVMVVTNLVLLFGLIFLNWEGYVIVAAYFLETLIIGGFNIIKMAIILTTHPQAKNPASKDLQGWSTIPFFILHFGLFFFVQITIFIGFSSMMTKGFPYKPDFIPNAFTFFAIVLKDEWKVLIPNFIIGQVFLLTTEFLYKKEYATVRVETQMFKPYGRIMVQQFAVLLAGFLMFAFSSRYVMPLILIIVKTIADVLIIQWENRHKDDPNATFFTPTKYE